MKHGEIIFKTTWVFGFHRIKNCPLFFRYRFDPVPGIHNWKAGYFRTHYKTPRVLNEKKAWYASEGYGRRKRSPRCLPDEFDDHPRADRYLDKSWKKNKIRKQWMKKI